MGVEGTWAACASDLATRPNHPLRMPSILGILESALYVDDMHRASEFYQRVFGFVPLHESERLSALRVAPDQVLLLFTKSADTQPTVLPFVTVPPSDGQGQLHVAFAILPDELETWREHLAGHGIEIESEIEWPEGGRSLYFRDPDQHSVEVKTSDWDGTLLSTHSAKLRHP